MSRRQFLNVNALHAGFVPSAWRGPEADPRAFVDVRHHVEIARIAEAAAFDAVFLADSAAIAAHTTHIGLIGTVSTSCNEPCNIAHRFATLDHASGGRAGWNVVTTADLPSARDFGRDTVPPHAQRYGARPRPRRCAGATS